MRFRTNSLVEQHVGILAALIVTTEALGFEIVCYVPRAHSFVVELEPLIVDFDERIIVPTLS